MVTANRGTKQVELNSMARLYRGCGVKLKMKSPLRSDVSETRAVRGNVCQMFSLPSGLGQPQCPKKSSGRRNLCFRKAERLNPSSPAHSPRRWLSDNLAWRIPAPTPLHGLSDTRS